MFAKILATIFYSILSFILIAAPIILLTPNNGKQLHWLGFILLLIISCITTYSLTIFGINKIWGKDTNIKKE
jgi:uncharacterized Tic20 family protein